MPFDRRIAKASKQLQGTPVRVAGSGRTGRVTIASLGTKCQVDNLPVPWFASWLGLPESDHPPGLLHHQASGARNTRDRCPPDRLDNAERWRPPRCPQERLTHIDRTGNR